MTAKGNILVVEPNDVTRRLVTGILSAKGYGVQEAAHGDAALAVLLRGPDVVVIDADSEDPSVVGLLHKMRRDNNRTPVIAVSDSADAQALRDRLGLRHLCVLPRPVAPDRLMEQVESHMETARASRAAAAPEDAVAHEAFMRRALDLAQEKMDEGCGGPFGAVVARGGNIVGEGWDAVLSGNDPTAHAEIMAIRAAARAAETYDLKGCVLYASCEPCPMCLAALYAAGIDRLYYACRQEDAAGIGFGREDVWREMALPASRRALPAKMILHAEGMIVLRNWEKKSEKTVY